MDMEGPYHIGVGVEDLEAAIADLENLGMRFTAIQTRNKRMVGPNGPFDAELRFAYTIDGPPHFELVDAPEGSGLAPTVWHLGYWVKDLAAATKKMTDEGATVTLRYDSPDDEPSGFAYVTLPTGVTIELVDEIGRVKLQGMLDR
jgi:catechol 2,3-dioxygenase-like lactoylglutathione lyase family enzyme